VPIGAERGQRSMYPTDVLSDELARLRETTPAAGRHLDVVALIREDRDGR
jgi:hypothetical protein